MKKFRKHLREYLVALLFLVNVFIWYTVSWGQNDKLLVYFLDVGQGDSIFIQSPVGNQMIIDGGSGASVLQELSKVIPFHDKKIDVVVSTHPDKDHLGGLVQVLKHFNIGFEIDSNVKAETVTFENFRRILLAKDIKRVVAERGMIINLGGGVKFIILFQAFFWIC